MVTNRSAADEEMKDETQKSLEKGSLARIRSENKVAHEAAGKKSSTTQGGLAKLVFGKGEEQEKLEEDKDGESSEEKM